MAFNDHGSGQFGGTNGGAQRFQPQQSQYFQSYNASHFTQPPVTRRPYTPQQKDTAIRLLNKSTPAKTITRGIGGTCSKSNPYRWRSEELERTRRLEADRRERQLHRRFARGARNGLLLLMAVIWAIWGVPPLREYLLLGLGEIIGVYNTQNELLLSIWVLWKLCLTVGVIILHLPLHQFLQLYRYSLLILWICIIYERMYPVGVLNSRGSRAAAI